MPLLIGHQADLACISVVTVSFPLLLYILSQYQTFTRLLLSQTSYLAWLRGNEKDCYHPFMLSTLVVLFYK